MNRTETTPKSPESKQAQAESSGGCCATSELTSCCAPSAKGSCCGPQAESAQKAPTSCGCR